MTATRLDELPLLVEEPTTSAQAPAAPDRMRRTLGHLVQDTARLLRRRFMQHAHEAQLPLSRSAATVLRRLAREEGVHQASLAWALDMEPIALTRVLDQLQEMNLIERRPHAEDRRVNTLYLTAAAAPVVESIRAVDLRVKQDALEGFSEQDQEDLIAKLFDVRRNLATKFDQAGAQPPLVRGDACSRR
jgi:DNA-binding MarR family transcriptional regulator